MDLKTPHSTVCLAVATVIAHRQIAYMAETLLLDNRQISRYDYDRQCSGAFLPHYPIFDTRPTRIVGRTRETEKQEN